MQDKDLETRVARLESLLNRVALPDVGPSEATAKGDLDPAVLSRVAAAAERLRLLVPEMDAEKTSPRWDAADGLLARLLLDELAIAVRGCRAATTAAGARLERAEGAIEDAARVLDR